MKKYLVFPAVTLLLAVAMQAGAQDTLTGAPQDQSSSACSDGFSDSSQCQSQNQEQLPLTSTGPTAPAALPTSRFGVQQPRTPFYMDNGAVPAPGMNPYAARPSMPLPPEPLTEFQKFVASTTGQVLPIFGASLFRRVPSTFAPLDMTPVPPDYILGPGDELRIRVWGQVNFRADVQVDRSGEIYLPQIGQIHVAGLPFSDLSTHLRAAIGRVYRNFDLTADVGQIRAVQVYLAGEARRPGVYTVSSLSTLVDALFAGGGPSASGSLRHIELRRGAAIVADFDLYNLLLHGDKSKDVPVQSGDVIFIPPAGPQVAVTGSVRNPAIYELRSGESLGDAIADAGGASAVAAQARVSIERIDDHRDRFAMEVAWDHAGLATPLDGGDLIRVFSIVPMYQKTVTLRGNTANQGQFAWHEGMRISDLIPDKASLITRNYWWRRAQLGLPTPEFAPLENFPHLRQPSTPLDLPRREFLGQRPAYPSNSTSPYQPGQTMNQQPGMTGTLNPQDQNGGLSAAQGTGIAEMPNAPSSPDSALNAGQQASNSSLAEQMEQNGQSGQSDLYGQNEQARMRRAGSRTEVGPVAPEIDWDYAVIERQDPATLRTVLIPFDLGRLVLHHDASQDLALQPGDIVTIFSQDDIHVPVARQTKFVRLDGEFVHAGVYTVHPGETLRELVARAGGFTPNAYLYGSEFTRRSTRQVQQRRMDEYIQSLEMQMQRGNLALVASATTMPQNMTSSTAAQSSEQEMLARLRQMRATGRIVLEFKAGSSGVDSVPDIQLQDGDRFAVPPVPASVNVVGSVYDQNSFLYESSRRAGTYLRLAGGPNRDADKVHIFIIRADGSVVSRAAASSIWGNEFDTLRMDPGDTIVVPEKAIKPSALQGFLDWSQLFSQFALGAAALSVIQ